MAASDHVPMFFKSRLNLAGRPQMSTRPKFRAMRHGSRADYYHKRTIRTTTRVPANLPEDVTPSGISESVDEMRTTICTDVPWIKPVPVQAAIARMIATSTRAIPEMYSILYRQIMTVAVMIPLMHRQCRSYDYERRHRPSGQFQVRRPRRCVNSWAGDIRFQSIGISELLACRYLLLVNVTRRSCARLSHRSGNEQNAKCA
jgi:hypothetical protein